MRPIALTFLLCFSALQLSAAAAPEPSGPAAQALRQRVEEFYTLLQQANWSQAEAFLVEESKEIYRNQPKNPFLGFEVISIKVDPDGETATSIVELTVFVAAVPAPAQVRRTLRWRLVEGNWYAVLVPPDPQAFNKLFQAQRGQPATAAPPPEDLKFKEQRFDLGYIFSDEKKVAVFPFANATDHIVTIAEVITDCECLKLLTEKRDYKPGETGELTIEFDPAGRKYAYVQTVMVKTEPGDRVSYLTISAYIRPRPPQSAEGKSESKL